jgi:hypothetical protein
MVQTPKFVSQERKAMTSPLGSWTVMTGTATDRPGLEKKNLAVELLERLLQGRHEELGLNPDDRSGEEE